MMKSSLDKSALLAALILGNFIFMQQAGAESVDEVFTLDPLIITAQRTQTKDLDTPAAVEVYDRERIEKTGAANAYEVLQNTLGVVTQSLGYSGTGMTTMTSKVMIRGVEKGTLVLVDGISVNQDGKYNLEDIPAGMIERIEVVKGGGAVLYGSEATGGVINIITKKEGQRTVSVSGGNYGKERYALSAGEDKLFINASLENRGHAGPMSAPSATGTTYYDYGKGERKSFNWKYKFNDALYFSHNFSENEHEYWQHNTNATYNDRISQVNEYRNHDNSFLLSYDKNDLKANISYGTQEKDYWQRKYSKTGAMTSYARSSWRKGHNTNGDVQKLLELGKNKLIIGADFRNEDMDVYSASYSANSNYRRYSYSLYTSYDWALGGDDNLIFNLRETWAAGIKGKQTSLSSGETTETDNDDTSKFTPEVQYLHKFNENSSLYAKAGKSFRLPNLTQIFGTGLINPNLNLKPEQGMHYEVGYKLNEGNRAWRLAIFNYKIKDSIEAVINRDSGGDVLSVDYTNQDVRNTGAELSLTIEHDNVFSSSWGIMVHNPQAKSFDTYGDYAWHDFYGRIQFTSALNYHKDKVGAMLSANYVGKRTSSNAEMRKIRSQLFTDLHLDYSPQKEHKIFLHLNNLLDRKDITTNSGSNYYTLGRNFVLGYEYSF